MILVEIPDFKSVKRLHSPVQWPNIHVLWSVLSNDENIVKIQIGFLSSFLFSIFANDPLFFNYLLISCVLNSSKIKGLSIIRIWGYWAQMKSQLAPILPHTSLKYLPTAESFAEISYSWFTYCSDISDMLTTGVTKAFLIYLFPRHIVIGYHRLSPP